MAYREKDLLVTIKQSKLQALQTEAFVWGFLVGFGATIGIGSIFFIVLI